MQNYHLKNYHGDVLGQTLNFNCDDCYRPAQLHWMGLPVPVKNLMAGTSSLW